MGDDRFLFPDVKVGVAAIIEGPITSDKVLESLESYHPAAGDWALLMEMGNVVGSVYLDERQTIPRLKAKCNSNQDLSMEVLVRNEEHPSVEYAAIGQSIRYVQTENERVYALANPPSKVRVPDFIVTNETGSLKESSVASSVVVQVNERMNLFKSLLFAFPAVDASGKPTHLTLGSITDEVKELFASATSTSDQARLTSLVMVNLVDDVSKETSYLSRAARFPQLSHTLVTYILQSHYFNGSMDGNEDGLNKSFLILTLLAPSKNNGKLLLSIFFFYLVVKLFSFSSSPPF